MKNSYYIGAAFLAAFLAGCQGAQAPAGTTAAAGR